MKLPFGKLGLVLIGGIGLILAVFAVWNAWATMQVEERLSKVEKENLPIKLSDLAPPQVAPEKNAFTYLRRAEKSVNAINQELGNIDLDKPWDGETLGRVGEIFRAHGEAELLLSRAAALSGYAPDADYNKPATEFLEEMLERMTLFRAAGRALIAKATWHIHLKQTDNALDSLENMLRLTQLAQAEPTLVSYLTRCALTSMLVDRLQMLLRELHLSDGQRERVAGFLDALNVTQDWKRAIQTERAFAVATLEELRAGPRFLPASPTMKSQLTNVLDQIAAAEQFADKDYQTWMDNVRGEPGALARNQLPALRAAAGATARVRAQVQCLRVALELQQQDDQRQLADLQLPEATTTDPYNGKPLQVKRANGLLIVYSVGQNLQDDGGQLAEPEMLDVGCALPLQ